MNLHFLILRLIIQDHPELESNRKRIRNDPSFKGAYPETLLSILYSNKPKKKAARARFCADVFKLIPIVIYTQKGFYLLEAINDKIEAIQSTGLIKKWHLEHIDEKFLNTRDIKQPKAFNVDQLMGSIEILLCGYAVCLLVFFMEIVVNRTKNSLIYKGI